MLRTVYSQLDLVVTVALMVVTWFEIMPQAAAGPHFVGPLTTFFDYSWGLDMAFKAQHGILVGRDVVFQYGPLYQWLWSLPSRVQGFSLGSFFATNDLFQLWMVVSFTYGTTALLLRGYAPWKRAFYIFLIVAFWQPQAVRASFLLFVLVCAAYLMQRTREEQGRPPVVRAAITSGLVVGSFLFSADCGVYACLFFAIAALLNGCFLWADKPSLWRFSRFLGLSAAFAALWVVIINSFMAGPFHFGFWRASFDLASNYRWIMGAGMTRQIYHRFFAYIAFGFCAFIFTWIRRRKDPTETIQNPASLLSIFLCSLLVLQSGIVRSDWGHVMMGVFPVLAVGFAILMGDPNQRQYRLSGDLPVVLVVILTAVFCGPGWYFQPRVLSGLFRPIQKGTCPADKPEFDHACVNKEDYEFLAPVVAYLTQHTSEKDRILIFPHESIYGVVARRVVAGGVLHLNEIMSPYLAQVETKGLDAEKPSTAVYSVDKLTSWQIDAVPNLTRVPEVWLYLQSHYQRETEIRPSIFSLRASEERQHRWSMRETALPFDPGVKTIRLHKSLKISTSLHSPPDMDLLRLRITVQYPFWWRFSKPSHTFVEIVREDGSYSSLPILVRPNRPHEIWIYPWEDRQLANYLAPNVETWRIGDRAPIKQLRLRFETMDFLSVTPVKMVVNDLSAITLSLN